MAKTAKKTKKVVKTRDMAPKKNPKGGLIGLLKQEK
jgi:hypothetical protein